MVSEKETAGIRRFVVKQLRDESDLSTLTLGILKKRYLAHVKCESLSPEAKKFMKQVAEEELLKMQENNENESETEIRKPQNKRKREKEQEEVEGEEEKNKSRAKKSRSRVSSSSSDSEDDEDHKTESPKQIKSHSKNAKKEASKSDQEAIKSTKQQITSDDDSTDEEMNGSEKSENESNESPDEKLKKKANTPKKEETTSAKKSGGKETQESDKESENDSDSKSEKNNKSNASGSSDDEKEKKVLVQKKTESDSDSSSPPSLEDENKSDAEDTKSKKKKEKIMKKDRSSQSQKNDNKAVVRLKRYISLCGVRKNYKKLLDGCRSIGSKVAVLKKELEDLGVDGNPSIDKCKKVRMKREEAQELAGLDVGNIITTQGRPKRRGISTRQDHQDPPSSTYQRTLNSGSENEENNPNRGRKKKISEWTNLRGIISDDADSD